MRKDFTLCPYKTKALNDTISQTISTLADAAQTADLSRKALSTEPAPVAPRSGSRRRASPGIRFPYKKPISASGLSPNYLTAQPLRRFSPQSGIRADVAFRSKTMSIKHVNDANFKAEVLDSTLPTFVDFWASWCGPCRMLAPRLEAAAETFAGRAVIAKYDVDESTDVAGQNGIQSIPTILVYKNGEVVGRRSGACDQATLNQFIESYL